jgi:hypothetical protein
MNGTGSRARGAWAVGEVALFVSYCFLLAGRDWLLGLPKRRKQENYVARRI